MDKTWLSRPEIVIPAAVVVWFAAAAIYASLFSS